MISPSLGQRGAIVDGNDAHRVLLAFEHHGVKTIALADDHGCMPDDLVLLAAERQREDALLGDHYELGEVEGVDDLAQNGGLWQ